MGPTFGNLKQRMMPFEQICEQEQGCTTALGAQDKSPTNEERRALPDLDSIAQHDARSDKSRKPDVSSSTRPSKSPAASDDISSEQEDATKRVPKTGRKVGRPILYTGDPHAPGLTSLESRIILRRNANRQSARRVRLRRQDHLEQLEEEVKFLREANTELSVQNKSLRDDRDSRRSDRWGVPRAALLPFSSTQEDTGFCEVSWKKTENSGTYTSEGLHNSGSAEWDGCFELIPPSFPGPLGPPHASDKRRDS